MTITRNIKPFRPHRFTGITYDARELGVSHPHLWMVLTGKRKSVALMKRYRALKKQQKAEAKAAKLQAK